MPPTVISGKQVLDGSIQRSDLDVSTVGQAVVAKLVQGTNVTLSSTGADSGTGDVTINVSAGGQGPPGVNACTTNVGSFTIPPVGQTVQVTMTDASWIVIGQMLVVSTAGGSSTASGTLQVTAKTGNLVTLLNPVAGALPIADTTKPGIVNTLSGSVGDFVDGTNACQNLVAAVQPTIWSARLRAFNAISNPTFEVDQRNVGSQLTNPGTGTFVLDRWLLSRAGTFAINTVQGTPAVGGEIVWPGTSFMVTAKYLRITLTTQQASLAAGDILAFQQIVEGSRLRELFKDVHSCTILCRSSVANLKFGLSLRDPPTITRSLNKLCQLGTAGTWTAIQLPNLPTWPSGANFSTFPGTDGYRFTITLATGSNNTPPANDVWNTGAYAGALGQDNWCNSPVNSTFDLAFISHEPGAQCSNPPLDCPFDDNLAACERQYQKSYDYAVKAGTVTAIGAPRLQVQANGHPRSSFTSFKRRMAKTPTIAAYSTNSGATGNVYDTQSATDRAVGGALFVGETGFQGFNATTPNTVLAEQMFHWTADTGW